MLDLTVAWFNWTVFQKEVITNSINLSAALSSHVKRSRQLPGLEWDSLIDLHCSTDIVVILVRLTYIMVFFMVLDI